MQRIRRFTNEKVGDWRNDYSLRLARMSTEQLESRLDTTKHLPIALACLMQAILGSFFANPTIRFTSVGFLAVYATCRAGKMLVKRFLMLHELERRRAAVKVLTPDKRPNIPDLADLVDISEPVEAELELEQFEQRPEELVEFNSGEAEGDLTRESALSSTKGSFQSQGAEDDSEEEQRSFLHELAEGADVTEDLEPPPIELLSVIYEEDEEIEEGGRDVEQDTHSESSADEEPTPSEAASLEAVALEGLRVERPANPVSAFFSDAETSDSRDASPYERSMRLPPVVSVESKSLERKPTSEMIDTSINEHLFQIAISDVLEIAPPSYSSSPIPGHPRQLFEEDPTNSFSRDIMPEDLISDPFATPLWMHPQLTSFENESARREEEVFDQADSEESECSCSCSVSDASTDSEARWNQVLAHLRDDPSSQRVCAMGFRRERVVRAVENADYDEEVSIEEWLYTYE